MNNKSIIELNAAQELIWKDKNQSLFGVTPVNIADSAYAIDQSLREDAEDFWNNGTCKLKDKLLTGSVIKDKQFMIADSFSLKFNSLNNNIGLFAQFVTSAEGEKSLTKDQTAELVEKINAQNRTDRKKVLDTSALDDIKFTHENGLLVTFPLITSIGFRIKDSDYGLRINATHNRFMLRKVNGIVSQKGWTFKNGEFADGKNHFSEVNKLNYPFLNAILGEQVTKDNFSEALEKMPEYDRDSVLYFDFSWYDEIERKVLNTSRRKISVLKKKQPINYTSILNAPNKYADDEVAQLYSNLVIIHSRLRNLEIDRTVIYSPTKDYAPQFCFTDCEYLFDAFKTTTNSAAGRTRVLLDNVSVDDGKLWVEWNGKKYNQYDVVFHRLPQEFYDNKEVNLSAFSRAKYNYLNDPKRIMLCAKLRGQAVPIVGQNDNITHEIDARVVFADYEGFSFGDSFIISESFAKKLEHTVEQDFTVNRILNQREYKTGDSLTPEDLAELETKNRFTGWRDIKVIAVRNNIVTVRARVPFGVGDKITNMHGSKGVVSMILPDDEMPQLQNDLSENMKAGAVDVITPGISVFRRKCLGQIFEAVTTAMGIDEIPLEQLYKDYNKQIEVYDKNSVFTMGDVTFSAPCGINKMIRLNHDSGGKQSFSYIKTNNRFALHFGEMELLNLASRGYGSILNELDLRDMNKHNNSLRKVRDLQEHGTIREEAADNTDMQYYFNQLGWDIDFNTSLTRSEIDERWDRLYQAVTNREVDLF